MWQSLEVCSEYLIGFIEVLRNHPDVADYTHVVCIAGPAGHDVHMEMSSNTSPGSGTEIETNVEPLWLHGALQDSLTDGGKGEEFVTLHAA
jgi:hypothetical protein